MVYAIWVILLVGLDRLSKFWAANWLYGARGGVMDALPGVFRFHYAENTGVAFSMLANGRWLVIVLNALLILAVLAYLVAKKPRGRILRLSLLMVAAGGIGNLIDRIALGYVIDFIEFTFVRFAVFNVADICVSMGAALSALCFLRKGEDEGGVGD